MNRKIIILISVIVAALIIVGIVLINLFAPKSTNSNQAPQNQLNNDLNTTIDSASQFGNDVQKLPDAINSTLEQSTSSSGTTLNLEKIKGYQQFEIKNLTQNKSLLEVDQSYYQNDAFFQLLQTSPIFERDLDFLSTQKAYFIIDYTTETSLFLGYDLSTKEKVVLNDKNYWFFAFYGTLGQGYFFLLDENLENMMELKPPKEDIISKFEFESPDKLKITYSNANDDSENAETYQISELEKVILNEDAELENLDGTLINIESNFLPIPKPETEPEVDYNDAQDSIGSRQQ